MHKIRIIKSKYNSRTYGDTRQELGELICVDCQSKISISMCERGNVINKDTENNPCYNPEPIKIGEIPLENCCNVCKKPISVKNRL